MKTFREFVTVTKAAKLIGVSPLTLRRWDKAGKLTSRRHPINRYRLYDPMELNRLLNRIYE